MVHDVWPSEEAESRDETAIRDELEPCCCLVTGPCSGLDVLGGTSNY